MSYIALQNMMVTLPRDIHPYCIPGEGVLVCVEAFQGIFGSRTFSIHRGIVLVAEHDAWARNAFSGSFDAPSAHGFPLITFQLPLAAGEAAGKVSRRQYARTAPPTIRVVIASQGGSAVWGFMQRAQYRKGSC
ncbi:sequence-specific DNA binding RNA polymerase II transcription factor [Alternaria alternata]|nr:sequence-specific DNA binding RNA polymerase II transcription factor [Alternaria alternata]